MVPGIGTFPYTPPDQPPHGPKADMWSLGRVIQDVLGVLCIREWASPNAVLKRWPRDIPTLFRSPQLQSLPGRMLCEAHVRFRALELAAILTGPNFDAPSTHPHLLWSIPMLLNDGQESWTDSCRREKTNTFFFFKIATAKIC